MPVQPTEVLAALTAATTEAKATIAELHSARAGALDVIKREKARVAELIKAQVEYEVGSLAEEARARMRGSVDAVIAGIAHDWRQALGLPVDLGI